MNKAILLSDLHLHETPQNRFEWMGQFIADMVKQYSATHKLYLLGDALEVRNNCHAAVLNQFMTLCLDWAKNSQVVILAGQHDSYKQGVHTLRALERVSNILIVDDTVTNIGNHWFIPFYRDSAKTATFDYYRKMLAEIPDNATVFTHVTLREAMAGFITQGRDMIELDEFERFEMTFSGDIHTYVDWRKPKDSANFSYVGMMAQRNFADQNCEPCYGVLVDDVFQRIPTASPRFKTIKSIADIPDNGISYKVRVDGQLEGLANLDNVNGIDVVDITREQLRAKLFGRVQGDDIYDVYLKSRHDVEKFGGFDILANYINTLRVGG